MSGNRFFTIAGRVELSPVTRRRVRTSAMAAGLLAVVLAASSCTSHSPKPSSSGSSLVSNGSSPAAGSASSSASASTQLQTQLAAATGDIDNLTWDLPRGEPTTLDPAQVVDYSPDMVASNICEPLMRESPTSEYSPNVAASYSQKTPLKLVFEIRAGIKFSDGTPLTAADVLYSMERVMQPSAPLSFVYANVKRISQTGASQVTVDFKTPDELFVKEMSTPAGMIVEKAYAEQKGKAFGTATGGLVCSGPFKLVSWKSGDSITLARNDVYWNPAYRAHAKTVTIDFVTDTAAITQGLLSGQFDGAYELPASVIPRLKSTNVGQLSFGASPNSMSLVVANPGGKTADIGLRQAIMTSIDRAGIASQVFHGAAAPNYTYLSQAQWDPAALSLYSDAYKKFQTSNAYNPSAAKALVKSSGYDGSTLTIGVLASDATQKTVAELIQQEAAQIGVKITIKPLQPLAYSNAGYLATARAGLDFIIFYAFNQLPDPMEFMGVVVDPGPYNFTNFTDPSAVASLATALRTFDPAKRANLILDAQAKYEAAYPATSLFALYETSFLNGKLSGAITSYPYIFSPSLALIGSK